MHKSSGASHRGRFWASVRVNSVSSGRRERVRRGSQTRSREPAGPADKHFKKGVSALAFQQRKLVQTC